jgi:hypothetical protein
MSIALSCGLTCCTVPWTCPLSFTTTNCSCNWSRARLLVFLLSQQVVLGHVSHKVKAVILRRWGNFLAGRPAALGPLARSRLSRQQRVLGHVSRTRYLLHLEPVARSSLPFPINSLFSITGAGELLLKSSSSSASQWARLSASMSSSIKACCTLDLSVFAR